MLLLFINLNSIKIMKKINYFVCLLFSVFVTHAQTPAITITTSKSIGTSYSLTIGTKVNNNTIQIDWGNSSLVDYTVESNGTTISGTLSSNLIKIYGQGISYLNVLSKNITNLDVSEAIDLKSLYCGTNQLTSLNVSKNSALTTLSCGSNQIAALDISNNTLITSLLCGNNKLTTLDLSKNTAITYLSCYSNLLTTLNISNNTLINWLEISYNKLTSLDISNNTAIVILGCISNQLNSLELSNNTAITELYCYGNKLTFHTLPIKQATWTTFSYSPQATIVLAKKNYILAETIDLSDQLTVNSNTTSYIWKTKGGATLNSDTDYTTIGGITTFLKGQTDSVYCQMTNATFPALTLSTTNIKVTDPTSIDSDTEQITKVYPNPVSNLLWVVSEESIKKIEIYTVVGAKVFEQGYNTTQKVNINTAEFPKGLLIVKVYGANGVMEKKILKE